MDKLLQLFMASGVLGYVLVGCMVLAFLIFAERLLYYHRQQKSVEDFLGGIKKPVENNSTQEALKICNKSQSPVSRVVSAVIDNSRKGEATLKLNLDKTAMYVIRDLERRVQLVAGLGNIAPLLGLLGTLIGLYDVFAQVKMTGNFTPMAELIGPVMNAISTTVLGLMVALIAECFYCILTERIKSIIADMEIAGIMMIEFLQEQEQRRKRGPAANASPSGEAVPAQETAS